MRSAQERRTSARGMPPCRQRTRVDVDDGSAPPAAASRRRRYALCNAHEARKSMRGGAMLPLLPWLCGAFRRIVMPACLLIRRLYGAQRGGLILSDARACARAVSERMSGGDFSRRPIFTRCAPPFIFCARVYAIEICHTACHAAPGMPPVYASMKRSGAGARDCRAQRFSAARRRGAAKSAATSMA